MGTVIAPGLAYDITAEDRLWAARMLAGESGTDTTDGAAVLWTMTQRFALGRWTTLTALFRAYSQPINPIWAANGSMCRVGGRYHGRPECSPERLARRARISSLNGDEIASPIRELVRRWDSGELPNPVPRAVEFADPAVTAGFVRRYPGSIYIARLRNHYVATPATIGWPADRVRIEGSGGLSGIGAGGAIAIGGSLLALVAVIIALMVWRWA